MNVKYGLEANLCCPSILRILSFIISLQPSDERSCKLSRRHAAERIHLFRDAFRDREDGYVDNRIIM